MNFLQRLFGTNPRPAKEITFVLIDETKTQDPKWLSSVCAALTKQAKNDFDVAPPLGWGVSAEVRLGRSKADVKPGEWTMVLLATPDEPDALGYHDKDAAGNPIVKIFPSLMGGSKDELSSCLSHEVLETLTDALGNIAVQGEDGKFWACEVCDAVEQDFYRIDGIAVSNFITPAYFGGTGSTRYDFMGLCKKALEVRPGGYSQFYSPQTGWEQVVHKADAVSAYRRRVGAMGLGRGARRKALLATGSPT